MINLYKNMQNNMPSILQTDDFDVNINSLHKIKADFYSLAEMLLQAVTTLDLELSAEQYWQLLRYLDTLLLWNKSYNLTAITQPKEALIKHIIDCLAIIPIINDETKQLATNDLLDIGAGAGLPSVILAICQPNRICTPVDSNKKKIRFIRQVACELQLANVQPMASRIEEFNGKFSLITSRAFASLSDFVALAQPYLDIENNGKLIAMKGKAPSDEELSQLTNDWQVEVTALNVPYLTDSRHLIILQPNI